MNVSRMYVRVDDLRVYINVVKQPILYLNWLYRRYTNNRFSLVSRALLGFKSTWSDLNPGSVLTSGIFKSW